MSTLKALLVVVSLSSFSSAFAEVPIGIEVEGPAVFKKATFYLNESLIDPSKHYNPSSFEKDENGVTFIWRFVFPSSLLRDVISLDFQNDVFENKDYKVNLFLWNIADGGGTRLMVKVTGGKDLTEESARKIIQERYFGPNGSHPISVRYLSKSLK